MANKDEHVELAKLAEQTERYSDMLTAMKQVAQSNSELTIEERNLLSVAYKNVIGSYRVPWRTISSIEVRYQGSERQQEMVKAYRKKIENELEEICYELLGTLEKHLIPNATTTEAKVFYLKMKGDYYRYLAEVTIDNDRQRLAAEAKDAYKSAFDMAQEQMVATDPLRLGLALNFSVFYYEITNEPDVACRLAKQAFDDALPELDCINDKHAYRDSAIIMQLLRDNLKLWADNEYDPNDTDQAE
ncbi:hypothetical protein I4U23_004400 [Adineta vaga]|nr:hypothetical protein I4U23_004400 [Adineta vaga]